jgi:hypothetical protein
VVKQGAGIINISYICQQDTIYVTAGLVPLHERSVRGLGIGKSRITYWRFEGGLGSIRGWHKHAEDKLPSPQDSTIRHSGLRFHPPNGNGLLSHYSMIEAKLQTPMGEESVTVESKSAQAKPLKTNGVL